MSVPSSIALPLWAGIVLLGACSAAPIYTAPNGVDEQQLAIDLSECRDLGGMHRGTATRNRVEGACMTARGYAVAEAE